MASEHGIRIKDLRLRVFLVTDVHGRVTGAPDVYAAHCSCGWMGDERRGQVGMRAAVRDGRAHLAEFGARPGGRRALKPIPDKAAHPD